MASKNIFPHPEEETNLSAPLEGEFANPKDDTGKVVPASLGTDAVPADGKLVGTDGNAEDKDSSLTVDTDAPETATEDLPDEVDAHDADTGGATSGG